jgi:cytoskeleton protein RodZ
MTTTNTKFDVTAPLPGPGAQLAQARLDLHWSREDVAARLHLATRQIQALEEDDYASLPGPTYARGYLKSYALLLGLSVDTILAAHTRLTARPVQQDFSSIAPQREITSHHHQIRFTTYLVALIVIVLTVAWWIGRETHPPVPLAVAPQPESSAAPGDATAPAEAAVDAGHKPEVAVPPAPVAAVAPAQPASPAVPAAAVTPTPIATAPAALAPAAVPDGVRVRLVLYADQDAWADIRDARQVKLLYETVPAGRAVTLEGLAPVSIFLGNAAGTRLEFNGKPVDFARHRRGMVARFTLGEEEAAVAPAP